MKALKTHSIGNKSETRYGGMSGSQARNIARETISQGHRAGQLASPNSTYTLRQMDNLTDPSGFDSCYLDGKLYERLTGRESTPLIAGFMSYENYKIVEKLIVDTVNSRIRQMNPDAKCGISPQSQRETMLLMVEFVNYLQTEMSNLQAPLFVGSKKSLYATAPVPVQFLVSEIGDSYSPGLYDEKIENFRGYQNAKNGRYSEHLLKRYNPDVIPNRCINDDPKGYDVNIPTEYYDLNAARNTDIPIYNENIPVGIRVAYVNRKFVEFLADKIIYEIKNKLKYEFDLMDPYFTLQAYGDAELTRKDKGISLQSYYSGKDEYYTFDDVDPRSERFPKLKRELRRERLSTCLTEKTIDADLINPRIPIGATDILFSSDKVNGRFKNRRQVMDTNIYGNNAGYPV